MSLKKHSSRRNIMFVVKIFSVILGTKLSAEASYQRVAQVDFDLRRVFKLYSSPGRDTSLYFPCAIEHATVGTAEDIKLALPKKFPNLLTVYLQHSRAQSTSLKVFCADRVFVFDVVPSTSNHIDYLKITGSHGELPTMRDQLSPENKLTPIKEDSETTAWKAGKVIYSSKKEHKTWQK